MILYPINELLKDVSSRYELVNLVAHRARQLSAEGEESGQPLTEKPVTIALNEARDGTLLQPHPVKPKQKKKEEEE